VCSSDLLKGVGAPLGVIPTSKYKGGSIHIQPGDMIVLYTDGAIEEKTASDEEYGLERFVAEIIKRRNLSSQRIIEEVYSDIRNFSNSPEQFDDFTVMILKFNDDYQFQKIFPAQKNQIPIMRDYILDILKKLDLSPIVLEDILLCCDEAATNILLHAYKETTLRNPSFELGIKIQNREIRIRLRDQGKPFEREKVPPPSIQANMLGKKKGGFGVYLIENLMNSVEYQQVEGYNEIIMIKKY
jgi:sigma-B regulation protein RsbU (phosphoserine phosphatase)